MLSERRPGVVKFVICARPAAPACAVLVGSGSRVVGGHLVRRAGVGGVDRRGLFGRAATLMMGGIVEEIIGIDLEPRSEEAPAEASPEPVAEPVPG